jgi:hypothetical protein
MLHAGNGVGGNFVDFSHAVGERLKRLQRRATRRGQTAAFTSTFRSILRSPRDGPREAGEPLYQLDALGLEIRTLVGAPVAIDYSVNDKHRIVWIQGGRLLARPES